MALRIYQPTDQNTDPKVLIHTGKGFTFSAAAVRAAGLANIHWMRLYPDDDDRVIVFELVPGLDKPPYGLKLGRQSSKSYRRLTGKGIINQTPWIKAVAMLPDSVERKFDLKPYHGSLPEVAGCSGNRTAWYIRLMPAFEESIAVAEIRALSSSVKGIYRYLGGEDGREVVYIGKGRIKDRYREEAERANWEIHRVEFSAIEDDRQALEWERWWIERHKSNNNGRRPRHNLVDGHASERASI